MMTRELVAARDRITNLLAKVAEIDDAEMQSHWARYLCALVCGFLEVAVHPAAATPTPFVVIRPATRAG